MNRLLMRKKKTQVSCDRLALNPHTMLLDMGVVIDDLYASRTYYTLFCFFLTLIRQDGGDAKMIDSAKDTSIPKVLSICISVCSLVCPLGCIPFLFTSRW